MFPPEILPSSSLKLEKTVIRENTLILFLLSIQTFSLCPVCSTPSKRIHSVYERFPKDLPCFGFQVYLQLQVRRFFCDNISCKRITFSEQIKEVVSPYARFTTRLNEILVALALTSGGQEGARIAQRLGILVSGTTLIQKIRQIPLEETQTPHILGVDDWAFRKGHHYGTILVDLQKHQVVDLLEERTAETLENWLKENPGVELITRDRAKAYAKGAKNGAKEAIQVADRFHLLKNLGEAVEQIFVRHHEILATATKAVLSEDTLKQQEAIENTESEDEINSLILQKKSDKVIKSERNALLEKPLSKYETKKKNREKLKRFRYEEARRLKAEGLEAKQISVE